jgi:hypothetical protein
MAPEVQDSKNHRKTTKVETPVLSQWNRWMATDFLLDQSSLLRKQWSSLRQVPVEDFAESEPW